MRIYSVWDGGDEDDLKYFTTLAEAKRHAKEQAENHYDWSTWDVVLCIPPKDLTWKDVFLRFANSELWVEHTEVVATYKGRQKVADVS
jgi:hypothetical protein